MADKSTRQKRYCKELKLQAATLVVEGSATDHQASEQLGVSDWALRCWVKAFRESGHLPLKDQMVPLAEELKAVRRDPLAEIPT